VIRKSGILVGEKRYPAGTEFRAELAMIQQLKPDVVFVVGAASDGARLIRNARALGLTTVFLGTHWWSEPAFAQDPVTDGAFYVSHFAPDDPMSKDFVDEFVDDHGYAPDWRAAAGHDAAVFLSEAACKSQAAGRSIAESLVGVPDTQTTLARGQMIFTVAHAGVPRTMPIVQVTAGEAVFVERVRAPYP
jgi:branched-chain amino acid transport system substrate-binding protein